MAVDSESRITLDLSDFFPEGENTRVLLAIETEYPLRQDAKDVLSELGVRTRPVILFIPSTRELYAVNLGKKEVESLFGQEWVLNISPDGRLLKTREISEIIR